ncbi:hypothetical protein BaRGS_00034111 [Batillaria attramentaria]|uniref:Uncharacterized protein n=1 Tax=Batillaria attramentaria TaxID=370345 RepID=A0ABD0JJJ7_9CAEN
MTHSCPRGIHTPTPCIDLHPAPPPPPPSRSAGGEARSRFCCPVPISYTAYTCTQYDYTAYTPRLAPTVCSVTDLLLMQQILNIPRTHRDWRPQYAVLQTCYSCNRR